LACSFLTVAGVIKLRITHPELPRPYRAWGYPVTPVVFLSMTAFMMYYLVTQRPAQSFVSVVIMGTGFGLYYLSRPRAVPGLATQA
jgi:APA family basic amino acid/polyamine antiporter